MARSRNVRYGAYDNGPDPMEPPYDIRQALDDIGDDVLSGMSPRDALNRLLRRGSNGRDGLDSLRRQAQQRRRELRNKGRLDGTLEQVRELLDKALDEERRALFPIPDDSARMAEAELDTLPSDTSRAVRDLAEYQWRSPEAQQTYQQIQDLLRSEVLDAQFDGLKSAMQSATPEDFERIRQMMSALNDMLDADARGEHTPEDFAEFMENYADFFPEQPADLDELVDQLARRAAAAQQLMNSLTPEQRDELANLMAGAMGQAGLGDEMARLQQGLQSARPDLQWGARSSMDGEQGMGFSDATGALAELADLDQLAEMLGQDYPGASLDDIDEELVERALGRPAVEDMNQLRRIERELRDQGYVQKGGEGLKLSARALRRLGSTALRRVFATVEARGRGTHDVRDAGASGEITGASREWQFGDEQPLDVVRSLRNSVMRTAGQGSSGSAGGAVRMAAEDFEVVETERRSSAAIALLVDMSYSMEMNDLWGEAKTTALALHSLVTTRYPQDAIEIIGFSDYARVMSPNALVEHDWDAVKGTNLQHALMLARRHLDKHRGSDPMIFVITDGEPTAYLAPDGFATFDYPPTAETLATTLAEVERCTRRGVTINVFMLDDRPQLVAFMQEVARRNGGRLFQPKRGALGEYLVEDFLASRRAGRRRAG